jgi:hypothetical protein
MEELIKIADTYQGDQNVTMFIPPDPDNNWKKTLPLIGKIFMKLNEDGEDETEEEQVGHQRRNILFALVQFIHPNEIDCVSPMGLILYGGIRSCGHV